MRDGHDGKERVTAGQFKRSGTKDANHRVDERAQDDAWDCRENERKSA